VYVTGKALSAKNNVQPALDYLGITGKGSISNKANQIINHLASSADVLHPDTVAIRCMKKWFMKPLDGQRLQGIFRKVQLQVRWKKAFVCI
jgi:hypothetical protein